MRGHGKMELDKRKGECRLNAQGQDLQRHEMQKIVFTQSTLAVLC